MELLLHLIFAFTSIIFAGVAYAHPSRSNLYISYGLIAGTLSTGIILTAGAPAHAVESVVSGIIYLAIVSVATAGARRRRLASE